MKKRNMKQGVLMILGVATFIGGVITAIKCAKEEVRDEDGTETEEMEEETTFEFVKRKVETYFIPIILCTVSLFSFIFANHISMKQTAVALGAYRIVKEQYDTYVQGAKEVLTKGQEEKIQSQATKVILRNADGDIYDTGDGTTLFYDIISKQKFFSDIPKMRRIEADLNEALKERNYISLNEFYDVAHLKRNKEYGDDLGWNAIDGEVTFGYFPQVLEDGERCVVLTFRIAPYYNYID